MIFDCVYRNSYSNRIWNILKTNRSNFWIQHINWISILYSLILPFHYNFNSIATKIHQSIHICLRDVCLLQNPHWSMLCTTHWIYLMCVFHILIQTWFILWNGLLYCQTQKKWSLQVVLRMSLRFNHDPFYQSVNEKKS